MKMSAQVAMWGAVVFATICLGVSITGFASLDGITDATERSDARGYSWFWLFLGAISIAAGVVSWWVAKTEDDEPDRR
jgi:hypothetical protein